MPDLSFKLVIDVITDKFDGAGKTINKFFDGIEANSKKLEKVGTTLSAALTLPITAFAAFSIGAFKEQEKNFTKFTDSFEKQGAKLGFTFDELKKQAEGFAATSTFQDDDILGGVTSQLLNFQIETKDIFKGAQQVIVDFAAKTGSDLGSATEAIGKALQNPAEGLNLLKRQGLAVSDSQVALIANLDKTGKSAKAQAEIIKLLQGQYAGFAQKIAQTDSGQLDVLIKKFTELKEDFGEAFLKVLRPVIGFLADLIDMIRKTTPETKVIIAAFAGIAAAIGPILVLLPQLVAAFKLLGTESFAAFGPIGIAIAAIGAGLIFISEKFGGLKNAALSFAIEINKDFLLFFELIDKIPGALAAVIPGLGIVKAAAHGMTTVLSDNIKSLGASLDANIAAQQLDAKGAAAGKALGDGINKGLSQAQMDRLKQQAEFLKQADKEIMDAAEARRKENAPKFAEGLVNFPADLDKQNGQLQLLAGNFDEVKKKAEELNAAEQILSDSFANFFESLAFGTKSAGDAFKELGRSIIQSLFSTALRNALNATFSGLLPGFTLGATPKAEGGAITGPGTGTSDSILARLSNGEFVIKAASVKKFGVQFFDMLNAGFMPKLNLGGHIQRIQSNLSGVPSFAGGGAVSGGGAGNVFVNIDNRSSQKLDAKVDRNVDPRGAIINVVLEDLRTNGLVSQQIQGAFSVRR